jgi:hypothetical protein
MRNTTNIGCLTGASTVKTVNGAKVCFYCVVLPLVPHYLMDFDAADLNRKTRLTGIRLFVDQFESLNHLRVAKHRGRCTIADLIREALDQYIERETDQRPSWQK